MSNDDSDKKVIAKNRYIFAGAGAVLGGLTGLGIAGAAAAVAGALLGGLLGYHMLKRI